MKQLPPKQSLIAAQIRRLLLSVLATGTLLPSLAWGQTELKSAFTPPLFVVGETVVGKEGWEMTNPPGSPIYTDPDEAMLIHTPIVDTGQETTLGLKTAIKNVKIANPGNVFQIEAQLSVSYNHEYKLGGGVYFQFYRLGSMGPFHFGFAYGKENEEGGLYYWGHEGRVLVVPLDRVVERVPYRFVFHVDMLAETFKVEVTGKDISGNPFRHQSEEVRFIADYHPFKGETMSLFIGNERPTLIDAYVDYVKVIGK